MSFLETLINKEERKQCNNCGNLIKVRENLIGCKAKDKLILPDFPPYTGLTKCKDWCNRGA